MNKLWTIAYKDIRTRFTDRTLLIIMLAAPLAISTIIGLAFGGLGRSESPIQHIPVAVINEDQASAYGVTFGDTLAGLLIEGQLPAGTSTSLEACPQNSGGSSGSSATNENLGELIDGTAFDQGVAQGLVNENKISPPVATAGSSAYLEETARAAVDKGLYTAVVIIPPDFSSSLTSLSDPQQSATTSNVTVYGNAGYGLSAGIVRSVVDSITAQMISGNIAIGASIKESLNKNKPRINGMGKMFKNVRKNAT